MIASQICRNFSTPRKSKKRATLGALFVKWWAGWDKIWHRHVIDQKSDFPAETT
jgi:hypothetical protein